MTDSRGPESGRPATERAKLERALRTFPLFESCTQAELAFLVELGVATTFRAGAILTHEGAVGGVAFILLEGTAETTRHGSHLATVGPGDIVGELALLDGAARSAEVRAITDVQALVLSSQDFQTLVDRSPHFVKNLLRAEAIRLRDVDSQDGST